MPDLARVRSVNNDFEGDVIAFVVVPGDPFTDHHVEAVVRWDDGVLSNERLDTLRTHDRNALWAVDVSRTREPYDRSTAKERRSDRFPVGSSAHQAKL